MKGRRKENSLKKKIWKKEGGRNKIENIRMIKVETRRMKEDRERISGNKETEQGSMKERKEDKR
jgi:hypothetical protein